ncbi:RNA-guided endonuclease InsQ/TnpB family protein [Sulfuricurvum sp.]|uniref:RNA-guided endonuclease InsQ/TnpB family protein n=1 Tax=Sulfuricurvum sp. TaxID=2025608 RepID=UPI0035687436
MQLTQKIKISPTKEQEMVLIALSEKCRLIYNFALTERKEAFVKGIYLDYNKQQNGLPKTKEKYPEYCWVYSKVLQMTLKNLDNDFKSFFALIKKDATSKQPNYKGEKHFTTMCYNQSGFKLNKGIITLSHKHPSKIKLNFKIPEKFIFDKIYQVDVYKNGKQYFLSITYDVKENEFTDNGLYQAFDLGILKHTAVNMSGKFFETTIQRPDRYWEKSLSDIQSRKDHCKKYSRKWIFYNDVWNKLIKKSSNQMKDNIHKLSRKVIDNTKANTIIVGDLSPKQMCKIDKRQKGLHRSLHNTGIISRFVSFLTYKAKLVGKRVIENNEYKTSQKCCCCGNMMKMPLEKREYICDKCGNKIDRDRNSAVNMMINYLSQNGLWTAYWLFVSNLRQTGLAIVNHPQEITNGV